MTNSDSISEETLIEMQRSGAVRALRAVQSGNGRYGLVVVVGMGERILRSQREDVRTWASLDTLARYTREKIGMNRFEVVGQ